MLAVVEAWSLFCRACTCIYDAEDDGGFYVRSRESQDVTKSTVFYQALYLWQSGTAVMSSDQPAPSSCRQGTLQPLEVSILWLVAVAMGLG